MWKTPMEFLAPCSVLASASTYGNEMVDERSVCLCFSSAWKNNTETKIKKEVRLLNPCIDTTTLLQNESLFIDSASKNAQKHHSSPHKNGHKKQIFYDAEKKKICTYLILYLGPWILVKWKYYLAIYIFRFGKWFAQFACVHLFKRIF